MNLENKPQLRVSIKDVIIFDDPNYQYTLFIPDKILAAYIRSDTKKQFGQIILKNYISNSISNKLNVELKNSDEIGKTNLDLELITDDDPINLFWLDKASWDILNKEWKIMPLPSNNNENAMDAANKLITFELHITFL